MKTAKDIPDDFKIMDLSGILLGYPLDDQKYAVTLMFRVLISFLDEHGLTKRKLLHPKNALPDDFVLRRGDLTDEGLEFFRRAEQKWLSAHDRGTSVTDTGILVKVLRALRSDLGKA